MEEKHLGKSIPKLEDTFGRTHNYLRLSLTDRCNLRCTYCMPAHPVFMPHSKVLSAREIVALTENFVNLGINKVRLTGGEPLVRKDFPEILSALSKFPVGLHLTTNGFYADEHIDLIARHVDAVNVSLDTLKKDRFKLITQRNALDRTLENIDLLMRKGVKTKINVVLVRNINDDEIEDFIDLSRSVPLEVRFIEFMPFGGNRWKLAQTYPMKELLDRIRSKYEVENLDSKPNQTSTGFRVKNSQGSFGVISTVSQPFCEGCNRIRITADGKIKNCLFSNSETDLRPLIYKPEEFTKLVKAVIRKKHFAYGGNAPMIENEDAQDYEQNRSMTAIGG